MNGNPSKDQTFPPAVDRYNLLHLINEPIVHLSSDTPCNQFTKAKKSSIKTSDLSLDKTLATIANKIN